MMQRHIKICEVKFHDRFGGCAVIINNAKLVLKNEVLETGSLLIENGIIAGISASPIAGSEALDAGGAVIMPGFIDIHIHGCCGIDFMDAGTEDYNAVSEALYSEGVTTYLATTLTSDRSSLEKVASSVKEAVKTNPSLGGIHLEGPYISEEQKGAQNAAYIRNADMNEIMKLQELSGGNVRYITLAPEKEGALEFIPQAVKAGVTVSAGHTGAGFADIEKAIGAGLTNTTHTHNAMTPHHHRKPGVVTAAMYFDSLFCEMICDGIHVCPDSVKTFYKVIGEDRFIIVTDALKIKHSDTETFRLFGLDCVRRDGAAYLASGPLAGSLLTMDSGLRNMRKWTGAPLTALAKITSTNAARSLGFSDRGEIAEGKLADLVMLDGNLNVKAVYKSGKKVF